MAAPHAPPLAVDCRGNALVSFAVGAEDKPPGDAPPPVALVALWRGHRVLTAFNRFRRTWDPPGGRVDPGERPRQAAARELLRETGHVPDGPLRFVGFASLALAPDRRAEDGAPFTGRAVDVTRPFRPSDEIEAIRWWDLREAVPGDCGRWTSASQDSAATRRRAPAAGRPELEGACQADVRMSSSVTHRAVPAG
ncbi:NUDIX hydrolase [Streptomyces caeni]|uniref:NUDIX hydrolase n=1 Tax=Streptomyces caeni TaxID=2307231 RepID=A0ABW4IP53_9ACTN